MKTIKAWDIRRKMPSPKLVWAYTCTTSPKNQLTQLTDAERIVSQVYIDDLATKRFKIGGWFREDYSLLHVNWLNRKTVRRLKTLLSPGNIVIAATLENIAANLKDLDAIVAFLKPLGVSLHIANIAVTWPGEGFNPVITQNAMPMGERFIHFAKKYRQFNAATNGAVHKFANACMLERGYRSMKSMPFFYLRDKSVICTENNRMYHTLVYDTDAIATGERIYELSSTLTPQQIAEAINATKTPGISPIRRPWTKDKIAIIIKKYKSFLSRRDGMKRFLTNPS